MVGGENEPKPPAEQAPAGQSGEYEADLYKELQDEDFCMTYLRRCMPFEDTYRMALRDILAAHKETDKDAYITASNELSTTREIARELAEALGKDHKHVFGQAHCVTCILLAKAKAAGLLDDLRSEPSTERKS